ncbi:hypothetical protein MP228_004460 [Amoeboaphelidium protococcarum]|nr:hypothetical protein MP228_004460 [Amoeboaphelidium protococcarum]
MANQAQKKIIQQNAQLLSQLRVLLLIAVVLSFALRLLLIAVYRSSYNAAWTPLIVLSVSTIVALGYLHYASRPVRSQSSADKQITSLNLHEPTLVAELCIDGLYLTVLVFIFSPFDEILTWTLPQFIVGTQRRVVLNIWSLFWFLPLYALYRVASSTLKFVSTVKQMMPGAMLQQSDSQQMMKSKTQQKKEARRNSNNQRVVYK